MNATDTEWTFIHELIHAVDMVHELGLTENQVLGLEKAFRRVAKLNKWNI